MVPEGAQLNLAIKFENIITELLSKKTTIPTAARTPSAFSSREIDKGNHPLLQNRYIAAVGGADEASGGDCSGLWGI
jgi:hypothetical protein